MTSKKLKLNTLGQPFTYFFNLPWMDLFTRNVINWLEMNQKRGKRELFFSLFRTFTFSQVRTRWLEFHIKRRRTAKISKHKQIKMKKPSLKSYSKSTKNKKIFNIVLSVIVICIVLSVALHQTSQILRTYMFTNPEDIEEWDDHIQIAIILRGKLLKCMVLLLLSPCI